MQVSYVDVLNYSSDIHVFFMCMQANHDLQGKSNILTLIRKCQEGRLVVDVEGCVPICYG